MQFDDFKLFPGAFLRGAHASLNLRDVVDVYNGNEYELAGGGRLPEQRPSSEGAAGAAGTGNVPAFVPGKVIEQTTAILARGDLVNELREYLESAKTKMPGKFKSAVQNMLIRASRQGRVKCACLLIDDYGADVNAVSAVKKHSSLHFAAYNGDKALAKELLSRGASKTLCNVYDETPEQTAHNQVRVLCIVGRPSCVEAPLLLQPSWCGVVCVCLALRESRGGRTRCPAARCQHHRLNSQASTLPTSYQTTSP
jgi:hypothetical protein